MAHTFYSHGDVALIYWLGPPEMADLDAVVASSVAAAAKSSSGRLFWISVVPEDAGPPTGAVAHACGARLGEVIPSTGSMHMVLEGSGFFVGFKRSVLTGILLAAGLVGNRPNRPPFRVYTSLDALHAVAPFAHRDDLETVLDQLYKSIRRTSYRSPSPATSQARL